MVNRPVSANPISSLTVISTDKLLKTLEHHRSLTEKNDLNMATRSVVALTYMFSLFAQHGDFDNIRDEDAAVGDEIDDISQVWTMVLDVLMIYHRACRTQFTIMPLRRWFPCTKTVNWRESSPSF